MLRARFGYLPGAAILSPAFSGSAGIIDSRGNGLILWPSSRMPFFCGSSLCCIFHVSFCCVKGNVLCRKQGDAFSEECARISLILFQSLAQQYVPLMVTYHHLRQNLDQRAAEAVPHELITFLNVFVLICAFC